MNRPDRPNLLILGHGEHGKDTVADIVAELLGVTTFSSSLFAAERVMMPAFARCRVHYNSALSCYEDRRGHRTFWHEKIKEYNTPDKARLAKELLKEHNIYTGMRCKKELIACLRQQLFDGIIWVDASLRKSKESVTSMTIDYDPSYMAFFDNNTKFDMKNHIHLKTMKKFAAASIKTSLNGLTFGDSNPWSNIGEVLNTSSSHQ